MKKLYMVGLVLILILAVAMIAYGTWLNKSGENQIVERMENRTVPLQGAKVQTREIHPKLFLDVECGSQRNKKFSLAFIV